MEQKAHPRMRAIWGVSERPMKAVTVLQGFSRRLGVHVPGSVLMNPGKSVTAVIGLSDRPQMARIRGCAWCSMREICTLRKGGKSCAL